MKIKTLLTAAATFFLLLGLQVLPAPQHDQSDGPGVTASLFAREAQAATANPSPSSPGYTPMVIPILGSYTGASTKTVVKFKAPNGYRVVAASATPRSSGGTNPTLKIVGKTGAYVNYSGSVTAGTTKDLTVTANKITDEAQHQIDLVVGGTATPTWRDITVMLLLKRL